MQKSYGLSITDAVRKLWHYLWGNEFTIRTDHQSLKNLLSQTIQTSEQQFFLTKLLGYKYNPVYKMGQENGVTDAITRRSDITTSGDVGCDVPRIGRSAELKRKNETDAWLIKMQKHIHEQTARTNFEIKDGMIFFND